MSGSFANPVDRHIGARLRLRRQWLQMTLEELAGALDTPLRQVEAFEEGLAHLDAELLFRACRVLQTDVSFFFDGFPIALAASRAPYLRLADGMSED